MIRKVLARKELKQYLVLLIGILTAGLISNAAMAYGFGVSGSQQPSSVQGNPNGQQQGPVNVGQAQPSSTDQSTIARLLAKARNSGRNMAQQAQQHKANQQNNLNAQQKRLPTRDSLGDEAFANTARNVVPMTPEQIKTLHYLFDQSQKAAAESPGVPPKPTSTSLVVDMSPGATPPVVRLSQGFVTSLVFVDATGAPWPIKTTDLGDPKAFNIQWDKKGNTLMVQALSRYKSGNLAVVLKGMDTPIMLTLMPGQNAVDYRVDLRVPRLGPNANPLLEGLPATGSPSLMNVLNGVPPQGAKAVKVLGADCQAWLLENHLFVRTSMTVMSPAWISTMSSPDGTHAYELQKTPVILALRHGKIVKLTIEGL